MAKISRGGFTLLELTLVMALFTLFCILGYSMLRSADKVFHHISGNEDATMQLKRAARMLQKDVIAANFVNMASMPVPPHLPGGANDGSALCMLSACAGGTGDVAVKDTGDPFWQRNILYYIIVPQGDPCQGGADANGFDDRCPHKALIRKIIDTGGPTTPADSPPVDEVQLAPAGLTPFLTQPVGRTDISNLLGEASVTQVELVSRGMVSLQVQLQPDPNYPHEVLITLAALNEDRGRKLSIGVVPLTGRPELLVNVLSLFPRNNR